MVPAPWTATHSTPSWSARQPVARRGVIVHHHAGTNFANLRARILGPAQVSYTAICDRGQLELMLPNDARRPWSANNAYWDSAMRSVCLNNLSTAGWTVYDQTVWSAARAIAFWSEREGWWPHRDGNPRTWTVIGHGEIRPIHGASNATACPGGVPLGLLTYRAQQLRRGIPEEEDMAQGAFYRNPTGGIFYQREPNTPLIPINLETWLAYAEQGARFRQFSAAQVDALIARFGQADRPEPTGGTITGDVTIDIDYARLARAIFDEQARRLSGGAAAAQLLELPTDDADVDQSDLDADGHDLHPTDAPYPEEPR